MNFVTEIIIDVIIDILGDFFSNIGEVINDIYSYCVEINQTKEVAAVSLFTMTLGASLSAVMVVKHIIGTYGLGTEGDPDRDPIEIMFRLCKALGLMGCNSWLFTEILKFSNAIGHDINANIGGMTGTDLAINMLKENINPTPTMSLVCICMSVGLILYFVSAGIRGAEITLDKILLPIFALDIINSNSEKWNMFIFQYGISFFSYLVQMVCFKMYLLQFARLSFPVGVEELPQLIVVMGWLYLSVRSPKWLEKYIYTSGAGQAIGRGAIRLSQVVMFIGMRR